MRTEKGTAAAEGETSDFGVTKTTRLFVALIDLKVELVGAFCAVGKEIFIVFGGGAAVGNGFGHNLEKSVVKFLGFGTRNNAGFGLGVNFGYK